MTKSPEPVHDAACMPNVNQLFEGDPVFMITREEDVDIRPFVPAVGTGVSDTRR
jgi:hypothetical protein